MTHPKLSALARYTHFNPTEPMSRPPTAGPATDAAWIMMVFRLMAFGRCSRGTSIGTRACRAGGSKAPIVALSPAIT